MKDLNDANRMSPLARPCGGNRSGMTIVRVRIPAGLPSRKKRKSPRHLPKAWQRMKDSNPHKQSQSLVCYRYTNPLYFVCSLEPLLL